MSQSPLARSSRRSLHAFAHPPSKLSKSSSLRDFAQEDDNDSSNNSSPTKFSTPTRQSNDANSNGNSTPRYRNVGSSANTPITPKIHYSPYATSTPPQGLSRSSSIPFDMAASAKAARRAEEEGRNTPVTLGMDIGSKKKRFVRRKPIWQRVVSFPQQLIDNAIFHSPTSIQDVLPDEHLANPIALALHAIHYLLVAPLFSSRDEATSVLKNVSGRETGVSSRWDRWENEGRTQSRGLLGGWSKFVFTFLFLLLAVGNAAYLFTRFRTYDMQLRSAQETVPSPHASPVAAPKIKKEDDDDVFTTPTAGTQEPTSPTARIIKFTGRALLFLIKFTFHATLSAFGKPQQDAPTFTGFGQAEDKIQSLRVWDPQEFCLAFFCAFPPTSPLLTHLLTPLHPFLTPLLHLSTAFLLSHLAKSYAQLVKDRMLLSAEVMREYDQRFVYKRVFSNRVDRGVGTHEAELVW
ncbi:hypothetical protein CI109_103824 [Kwoniella shandongensis]|uniref:Uncharacterized protein n=1 Tax=Kwoniella shandongensis TaxID=1734106 RepID=A0A5M6CCS1_9TREE|nr:uncharacterized protein CI109_000480 [Kwoniella shandongensis]KAA5530909.1 hypothetical protein CI109_000480 [Kwoniella shandongensis]